VNTNALALVVNVPPDAPPTLMPSVADRFPIVTTSVHTPLPVGVTVYVAGNVVDVVVIVATEPHPNWSTVGAGAFGVEELIVNVCAPAPAPVNASVLGVTDTELLVPVPPPPPPPPGGTETGVPLLLPPPQAERHNAAPTTAKNGRKRESIEPDLLATFG
jgi:hypothetical protein